jgi:SAM-dependent methyltransferase
MVKKADVGKLKDLYDKGENIIDYLKRHPSETEGQSDIIELSYDLQAGSYIEILKEDLVLKRKLAFTDALASYIDELGVGSLLEAGVGEATTLAHLLDRLEKPPETVYGFDISWSRIKYAETYLASREVKQKANLFTSDLNEIGAQTNSFDLVLTCHAIEPNGGVEEAIIRELARVSRNYILMMEPAGEYGSDATKQRIQRFGYCNNLREVSERIGLEVVSHELFSHCQNDHNQTELLLVKVPDIKEAEQFDRLTCPYACPQSHSPLTLTGEGYYSKKSGVVYPIIGGIPCLRSRNGVVATKYLEFSPEVDY